MIQYPITTAELEKKVDAVSNTWRTRAKKRTTDFIGAGKYEENSSIWSEIKEVYMVLQGESKCAFCERKLESTEHGKGEQDVEHFRPKRRVKAWSIPTNLKQLRIGPTQTPLANDGYYSLAYDLLNYCATCGPCNSALKASFFPIEAANHDFTGTDIALLDASESPLLIFPLGNKPVKAESLIGFTGMSPCALNASAAYDGRRALVTIEMFELDNPSRKNLILERCRIIVALFPQLELRNSSPSSPKGACAQKLIDIFTSSKAPHTNCARSFVDLYKRSPQIAETYWESAFHYLESSS